MSARLHDRVAVVTGGASGIGRATAELFAREGAHVVIADLNADKGQEAVAAVQAAGRRGLFVETDTSNEAANERLADAALKQFGRIDVLVAAAGISYAGYVSGEDSGDGNPMIDAKGNALLDKPVERWEKVLGVNLTGVFLSDRAIARRMIAAGNGGVIVNIASAAAKVPARGLGDYCVSKAGVWMLSQVLALELAPHSIRVNAIAPGFIETPMTAAVTADEDRRQRISRRTPLGRLGEPQDIANTALFLAGDESSFMTGKLLHPDGGIFTG